MQRLRIPLSEPEIESSFRVVTPRVLTADGRGISIRFEESALRELEWHVREGVKAINGHGVEVGGLVLGATPDWSGAEVVITGFVPVESEYLFGPTYRPSESDIVAFREAATSVDGIAVGYFRSQLRGDAKVRFEDARLLAELFPASDCCFISIHASESTPSTAAVYQVRPGADPVLLDLFALKEHEKPSQLPGSTALPTPSLVSDRSFPAVDALSAGPPSDLAETSVVLWKDELRLNRSLWIPAGFCAAFLLSATAFTIGRLGVAPRIVQRTASTSTAIAPVDSKIGLRMIERGPLVEIRWNAADPAIATAARGKLIITDSPGQSIDLDSSQLHAGLYIYRPLTRSLNVLLMIHQQDGSFTGDSKMFMATRAGLEPRQTLSGLRKTEPDQTVERKQPSPNGPSIQQASVRALAKAAASISGTQAPAKAKPGPVEVSALAVKNTAPLEALRVPTVLEPPATLPTLPSSGRSVSLGLPSDPAPPPVVAPAAVASRLLAPRLLHQAVPAVPLGVASRIRTEVRLDVSVSIDADGKAVAAHMVETQGAAAGLLAIEVLKAAQMSRFLPAEQDGKAVPGTMVLTFRFSPGLN